MALILFYTLIFGLSLYSYALIDPNLTLISHPLWAAFREPFVQLGYHARPTSWMIFIILTILLWGAYLYIRRHHSKRDPFKIALVIGGICFFSYPFLSHDFFNYLFDAKMLTYYGVNPYLHVGLDFPNDEWLRFMHWVHRPYPYGPTFLPLTLVPSFLAMGKFFLNYVFFKVMFIGIYILGVYYLKKINKRSALEFATHPFVILEGLINLHNDMLAVSFVFVGIYYLSHKRQWLARIMLLVSGGIKYLTMPLLLLDAHKDKRWNYLVFTLQALLFAYLIWSKGFQQWYFFLFFALLPYFPRIIKLLHPLFFGLMVSYYPYIRLGGWDTPEKVLLKDQIIYVSIGMTAISLLVHFYKSRYAHTDQAA
ncbi:hypothetical protein KBD81_00860 [Candidatus Woesebacteria bacterium]|nr:hypothetical protein [Candidatus Woesebacteria bacterium]